jgi:23S rRNA (adenine2503-C2)-methyltransferase
MEPSTPLLGLTQQELEQVIDELGHPPFRAKQIFHWLYHHGATSFDEMNNLPAILRETLKEMFPLGAVAAAGVNESSDGTRKYLFPTLHGGFVETAMIPEGKRATLCISTQVGCRRSCTFCQTARQGFQGNLSAGEIINQYHSIAERSSITNIVYMGMGEPLDNVEATLKSVSLFTDPQGYNLAPRRITLSTVGIHPQLERFLDESTANLAVSLHSPFPEERKRIMPVENANPMDETLRLIRTRREDRNRRISFEYTMFAGVNDTPRHVDGIARLLNGLSVRINLIPFHQIPDSPLRPTPHEGIEEFAGMLRDKGFRTSVRRSRGQDINAACGLLWTRHVKGESAGEQHDY